MEVFKTPRFLRHTHDFLHQRRTPIGESEIWMPRVFGKSFQGTVNRYNFLTSSIYPIPSDRRVLIMRRHQVAKAITGARIFHWILLHKKLGCMYIDHICNS